MTERNQKEMLATTLWASERDLNSFELIASVDGTNLASSIRKSLDVYFGSIGGVPDLRSHREAVDWAENLCAKDCLPESSPPQQLLHGHKLRINLARPVLLGLDGLSHVYTLNHHKDYADLVAIYRRSIDGTKQGFIGDIIRRSISENRLYEGLLATEAGFTTMAFKTYFDRRSLLEGGFVTAMKKAARMKHQLRAPQPAISVPTKPESPTDLRPWEIGLD